MMFIENGKNVCPLSAFKTLEFRFLLFSTALLRRKVSISESNFCIHRIVMLKLAILFAPRPPKISRNGTVGTVKSQQ